MSRRSVDPDDEPTLDDHEEDRNWLYTLRAQKEPTTAQDRREAREDAEDQRLLQRPAVGRGFGVDFGGVILNDPSWQEHGDTDYLYSVDPVPGALEGLTAIVKALGSNQVWVISKTGADSEPKNFAWLQRRRVFHLTGLRPDHVRFVRTYPEKAALCRELGITTFVDDRFECLLPMVGIVPRRYLLPSAVTDLPAHEDDLPQVQYVSSWPRLTLLVLASAR